MRVVLLPADNWPNSGASCSVVGHLELRVMWYVSIGLAAQIEAHI